MECIHSNDKGILFGMHLCKLDSSFNRFCTARSKKTILEITGSNLGKEFCKCSAERINQFLTRHRITEELRMNRINHFWMRPAMTHESISSKEIDIFSTHYILEYSSFSTPFGCSPLSCNGCRFTIFEPPRIEVFSKI